MVTALFRRISKVEHHEQREEGWGKEEKKITFRQVTEQKGIGTNFAVRLPELRRRREELKEKKRRKKEKRTIER
jgi:hypothetical protein